MEVDKTPIDILKGPAPASVRRGTIDFSDTPLEGSFAIILDNVLTPEECRNILALVQPSMKPAEGAENRVDASGTTTTTTTTAAAAAGWPPAVITTYNGTQYLHYGTRRCGRIVYHSPNLAAALLARVAPYLPPQVRTLRNEPDITGPLAATRGETWRLARLRHDVRFLRYQPGDYFREHCDAQHVEGAQRSYFTMHAYLSGGPGGPVGSGGVGGRPEEEGEDEEEAGLEGGATRFLLDPYGDPDGEFVDINPRLGSVLIFQQRDMFHEGCEVTKGVKYTLRTDIMYEKVESD
ncbi:hypothetical protein BX600DRAFT_502952 [Xylariales sp. PMI_506]|nr:hypothetical protein BX600DRAFT_502952 [Xylariales sp. PMI_506]